MSRARPGAAQAPARRRRAAPRGARPGRSRRGWPARSSSSPRCSTSRSGTDSRRPLRRRRDLLQHLVQLRPASGLLLREDELAVEDDLELSAGTLDERGIEATRLLDLGRQTGGPGQVVSLHAVGDLELHRASWGSWGRVRPMSPLDYTLGPRVLPGVVPLVRFVGSGHEWMRPPGERAASWTVSRRVTGRSAVTRATSCAAPNRPAPPARPAAPRGLRAT